MSNYRIESLLTARLFLAPQAVHDRVYFVSNLSGRLSLYGMAVEGSVPEPLIPADIALPNPHHLEGQVVYRVLPSLGKILLMLDHDGDENYQPTFVPIEGGAPEPVFGDRFAGQKVVCTHCDEASNKALFVVDPRRSPVFEAFLADLGTGELASLGTSLYGNYPVSHSKDFSAILILDGYTAGDEVLYLWRGAARESLFGRPLDERAPDEAVRLSGIRAAHLVGEGVLMACALFDDAYGLAWFDLETPGEVQPVAVVGLRHTGRGELVSLEHGEGGPMRLHYVIDDASWLYEGEFDVAAKQFVISRAIVGEGDLPDGTLESVHRDADTKRLVFSFSSAASPSNLYSLTMDGPLKRLTHERPVGIPTHLLSRGESYPYSSHDGLRIASRLYLPARGLGFEAPYPVVFYIHGGPQSQERPDFTWFSMPLIQYFTLNGIAVWAPNVRGSIGYGMRYMKYVDHDWGGLDRLDHVAAFELLRKDPRLDLSRAGVMGRSYGGYMTLTLAFRHPELWKAACDMFGPYDLIRFMERLPETWQTYFHLAVGHPVRDQEFLTERSPSTHRTNLACPMLVIQGANDPRVIERESRDVVEDLRAHGKDVDYVVYADEGHDVTTYVNKVDCYSRIVEFFRLHLKAYLR